MTYRKIRLTIEEYLESDGEIIYREAPMCAEAVLIKNIPAAEKEDLVNNIFEKLKTIYLPINFESGEAFYEWRLS